eukprot:250012_1
MVEDKQIKQCIYCITLLIIIISLVFTKPWLWNYGSIVFSVPIYILQQTNTAHVQMASMNCSLFRQSNLYLKECESEWTNEHNNKNIHHTWPLLITGTPRSGTQFMKVILRCLGIHVQHDFRVPNINEHGQVSWMEAFPTHRLHGGRFRNIVIQMRDPLAAIASMCTEPIQKRKRLYLGHPSEYKFVSNYVSLPDITENKLWIVTKWWYEWHYKLNRFGFDWYKMEDLLFTDNQTAMDILTKILTQADLLSFVTDKPFLQGRMSDALYHVLHQKINSRAHRPKLTWNELFALNEEYAFKIYQMSTKMYNYTYDWDYNTFNHKIQYNHTGFCLDCTCGLKLKQIY